MLQGLTREEAAERLRKFGPNRLVAEESWARLKAVVEVAADPMALMLLFAGVLYLLLGETRDGVVLLCALVPVLGTDVLLEARSRKALRALRRAVEPRARVIRSGEEVEIPSEELVPGDLLRLHEGDVLPADGVVREAANLSADESQLTGESEPVDKSPAPAAAEDADEAKHRFFAGSKVLAGQGRGEVVATGARTRYGALAKLVAEAGDEQTPLQRQTGKLVRVVGIAAFAVALLVLGLALLRGARLGAALIPAVSVAMAALPEEFPLVFALFLSLGAFRLGKSRVLVRRLASVETLGSTTVICVDKTGTLTHGEFALDRHRLLGATSERTLLEASALACEIDPGDAMDRAILAHTAALGVPQQGLRAAWSLVRDHPFDPHGKHMTHVWCGAGGVERVVAKGALEGVLAHCALAPGERERAEAENERLAGAGARVLAVAERSGPAASLPADPAAQRALDETGLRLLGLLAFLDPVRPEVPAAVAECAAAGIAVKMVTGDHLLTAHAVAHRAGIVHDDDQLLTGAQIDLLPPAGRDAAIDQAVILARVRPEQKLAVVESLQRSGEIVAMTGDGINDAPALRKADIGVSLGRRGTEVARAAAHLILLDDDFTSLVATVREGRRIYLNIQRAFLYLVAFHVPIFGLAALPPILGLPPLLLPLHLVWLELIVHPVSALLFEGEPAPADVMRRPPRDPKAPLLPPGLALRSIATGALITAAALLVYWRELPGGEAHARGVALAVQVWACMLIVFAERAFDQPFFRVPAPRGLRFWGTWSACTLSLPIALEWGPLQRLLHVAPLGLADWGTAALAGAACVLWRALVPPRAAGSTGARSSDAVAK